MLQNLLKYTTYTLTALLFVIMLGIGMQFMESWKEYQRHQNKEKLLQKTLQEKRLLVSYKESYLRKTIEDPTFLEHVVRERIGYVKPKEQIFYFKNSQE